MVSGIAERTLKAVERGEARAAEAREAIRFSNRAGINVGDAESRLAANEARLRELRAAAQAEMEAKENEG